MSSKSHEHAESGAPPLRRRKPRAARFLVGRVDEVPPGQSMKFTMPIGRTEEECFVINLGNDYKAYVNRCCHVPLPMDWVDNQFFTTDGRYLMCQTHNACYEPATGECVAGPQGACGKFLLGVPLEIKRGVIYARPPRASKANR